MTYSRSQILYHWLTAALVLLMAGTGMAYFYELGGDAVMRVHQIAGQLLIVVLTLRLVTRFGSGAPPANLEHPKWERLLATLVHIGLYLAMIAFVITGYVSASAETDNLLLLPVELGFARSDAGERFLETHYALKWALLALFALHFAGALKHAFLDRDATLSRMSFTNNKD